MLEAISFLSAVAKEWKWKKKRKEKKRKEGEHASKQKRRKRGDYRRNEEKTSIAP